MHLSPQPGMQGCLVAVDLRCLPADATFGPRGIVDTCASLLHSPCRKVGHIATYLDEVHGIKRDEKTCGAAAFKKAGDRPVSFEGLSTSGCMLMGCQHMLLLGGLNTTPASATPMCTTWLPGLWSSTAPRCCTATSCASGASTCRPSRSSWLGSLQCHQTCPSWPLSRCRSCS
jgi:hypothetical protein